jgi:protein-S-isoprenylcysteine O-methyltransferase Ste14
MSSLLTCVIHVYDPLDMFPAGFISVLPPANPLTNTLTTSLWNLLCLPYSVSAHLFQEILGIAVAVFGLLMVVRAFEVLGIDCATVVYLYYPEESKLVDHKIYSIVRNPLYAGAIVVGFGGVLLRASAYSAILWLLVLLVFSVPYSSWKIKNLSSGLAHLFENTSKGYRVSSCDRETGGG